jgi:hypothetical protein
MGKRDRRYSQKMRRRKSREKRRERLRRRRRPFERTGGGEGDETGSAKERGGD